MRKSMLLFLGVAVGCSSGSSPVSPVRANAIEAAHVLVGGAPVEGAVVVGERGVTVFQVRLRDRDASSLAGVRRMVLRYDIPGMGMMGNRVGEVLCYDDATHGDDIAGDGVFHRLDSDGSMGCGGATSPAGAYGYGFQCDTIAGGSCGEMMLHVTRR